MYRSSPGASPVYLLPALAFVALAIFAVVFDNGALLAPFLGDVSHATNYMHELFHDGRHLLGTPCH